MSVPPTGMINDTEKSKSINQSSTASPSLNIVQWEHSLQMTPSQMHFLNQISKLDRQHLQSENQQLKQDVPKIINSKQQGQKQEQESNLQDEEIQNLQSNNQSTKRTEGLKELKQIQSFFNSQQNFLNSINKEIKQFQAIFQNLQQQKGLVVNKITQFYNNSQNIINQQKILIDLSDQMQTNLQYYNIHERMEHFANKVQVTLERKDEFEQYLQPHLSEVTDAVNFYEAHPTYKDAATQLSKLRVLRQRLLGFTKQLLLKVLNHEYSMVTQFVQKQIDYIAFYDTYSEQTGYDQQILQILQSQFQQSNKFEMTAHEMLPDAWSLQHTVMQRGKFLVGIFPQTARLMVSLYEDYWLEDHPEEKTLQKRIREEQNYMNQSLAHLLLFLHDGALINSDFNAVLYEGVLQFYAHYRIQAVSTIYKAISSLTSSLKNTKYPQLKCISLVLVTTDICFWELLHYIQLFAFRMDAHEQGVQAHVQNLCEETFQSHIRVCIQKEGELANLLFDIDCLKSIMSNVLKMPIQLISSPQFIERYFGSVDKGQNQNQSQVFLNKYEMLMNLFLKHVQVELQSRLVSCVQQYVQNKICKMSQQGKPVLQGRYCKLDVVVNGTCLLQALHNRMQSDVLQHIARDVVAACLPHLVQLSKLLNDKFDAFLFQSKHLCMLDSTLTQIGLTQQEIVLSQLDFHEMKTALMDLLSGKIDMGSNWKESMGQLNLNSTKDKLWHYTSNIMNFVYKGLPKVSESKVDLQKQVADQLQSINARLIKDMSFIIAKDLCDFFERYHHLRRLKTDLLSQQTTLQNNNLNAQNDKNINDSQIQIKQEAQISKQLEGIQKDMSSLMNEEVIMKRYVKFMENLQFIVKDMIRKMNSYLDEATFGQLAQYVHAIIENALLFLQQYYIIVSANFSDQLYVKFEFRNIQNVKEELCKSLVFLP